MTEPQEYKIDRTGWASGPWDSEPDRVDFEFAGCPCLMLRNRQGAWCGYAAVAAGHPFYGKEHRYVSGFLNAHGGVNRSGPCSGSICHVPKPGEPDDVWWFGFDCCHPSRDLVPIWVNIFPLRLLPGNEKYRTAAYVRRQVESLATQLQRVQTHGIKL